MSEHELEAIRAGVLALRETGCDLLATELETFAARHLVALEEDAATLREMADEMYSYDDYKTLNAIADRLSSAPPPSRP